MTRPLKLLIRIASYVVLAFIALITVLVIFAGPIAERLIEKHDVRYIGREVFIDDLDVNLLNGRIEVKDFKIMERDTPLVFIGINRVIFDMSVREALRKYFHVEEMVIEHPGVQVYSRYDKFNFDDLRERFMGEKDTTATDTLDLYDFSTWDATIDTFSLDSGYFSYINLTLENEIVLDSIAVYCGGISTLNPETWLHVGLMGNNQGGARIVADVNYETRAYECDVLVDSLGIKLLEPYVQDYFDCHSFDAKLSANLHGSGIADTIGSWSGDVRIHDFLVLDTNEDSIAAWKSVAVGIDSFELSTYYADLQTLRVDEGYLRYEVFEEGDNWTSALKLDLDQVETDSTTGAIVSIPGQEYFNVFIYVADMTSQLIKAYTDSKVRIDSIGIHKSTIHYADNSLRENALFLFEGLEMRGTNFDARSEYVTFGLRSRLNKTGRLEADWRFNPQDVMEMELDYRLQNFQMSYFSPYSFHYTAYPLYYGDLLYEGSTKVHNHQIDSKNHLFIEDIEAGRKVYDDPPYKIPVRLGVILLRDAQGNVELDLPISGDLDDPNFHIWKVVGQVLQTLLVKTVTAPFRLLANAFGVDEEDLKEVRWLYTQKRMLKDQQKAVQAVGKVLDKKPDLALNYHPVNNRDYEMNEFAVIWAKRDFFLSQKPDAYQMTFDDTTAILGIQTKDSLFSQFIRDQMPEEEGLMSNTERCRKLYGEEALGVAVEKAIAYRDSVFVRELTVVHGIEAARLNMVSPLELSPPPDTFNLVGPVYLFSFDAAPDSSEVRTQTPTDQ